VLRPQRVRNGSGSRIGSDVPSQATRCGRGASALRHDRVEMRPGATWHTHRSGPVDSAGTVLQATSLTVFTGRVARWTLAGEPPAPLRFGARGKSRPMRPPRANAIATGADLCLNCPLHKSNRSPATPLARHGLGVFDELMWLGRSESNRTVMHQIS